MKRWTNGLPGATKRLGAMMAQRGLSVSQPRMRADTHDGPEQMLHVRGLIHCCSSHVRRSWSFCLATHGRAIHVGTSRHFALPHNSGRYRAKRKLLRITPLGLWVHCLVHYGLSVFLVY